MGLLDRFRSRTNPADEFTPASTPPTEPRGGSGRWHTDGFLDTDEINHLLEGRAGLEVFQKMWRTDPDCRRILTMCVVPIVAANWEVDPFHDKDEEPTPEDVLRADFVRWALMEQMRPGWRHHLLVAMTVAARDGFAPFEHLYRPATWEGRPVFTLDTLDLRLPRSVDRWVQEGHRLAGIEQFSPGGMVQGWGRAQIPAADLVYYRMGPEGDNWEGVSLLRAAYKNWHYKDSLELIDAIGHERTHVGIPTGYPAEGATPADLDAFEEALAAMRASDAGYMLMPGPHAAHAQDGQGWLWEIVTPGQSEGAARALQESLKHHRASIDSAILAEFMRLGQDGTGARATADVQQNPFWQLVESIAGVVIEDPVNDQLIPRLLGWNFDTSDGRLPKLRCSLIDSTSLEGLASYVGTLVREGAIRVEPTLEAHLREVADLPEADEEAILEQAEKAMEIARATQPDQGAPGEGKAAQGEGGRDEDPPVDAHSHQEGVVTLARQDRPLRPYEQAMSLDRIEAAIDTARDRVEQAAAGEALALARELAALASKGERIPPAPGPDQIATLIEGELLDLYATGRQTVIEELDRQTGGLLAVTHLAADDLTPEDAAELERMSADAADRIRGEIAAALARARVSENGPPPPVVAIVDAERAARAALRSTGMDYAAGALNLGRFRESEQREDDIEGTYYTSILDGRRCPRCAVADDDVLRRLDDPVRLSRLPPNRDCQGGPRCRCLEAFVRRGESVPLM